MITLYQLPTAFDLPVSVSPYCAKVELYLRLTERTYETKQGNLFQSPNRKVPYVRWEDDTISAESGEIIARLESTGRALDAGLEAELAAVGRQMEALCEDVVYWACLYSRFVRPSGWEHQKVSVRSLVPALLSPILVPLIRRSQVKLCAKHGWTSDNAFATAVEAIGKISEQIGDSGFLLGNTPHVADCMVWASLMHTSQTLADNPARAAVRGDARLISYIDRLADRAKLTLPPLR